MSYTNIYEIYSMSRGDVLALNKRNSLPSTVRTSIQRSCKQRVDCLLGLGYMKGMGHEDMKDMRKVRRSCPSWSGWLSSSSTPHKHKITCEMTGLL